MPQEVSARNFDGSHKELVKGGLSIPGGDSEQSRPPYTPSPPMSTVSSVLPSTDTSMIEGKNICRLDSWQLSVII